MRTRRWTNARLGEVLSHYQEYIERPEPRLYPKLSVKLYGKGVVLDTPADGAVLKMKRHQLAKTGQVILSEIWGKKGAIGFVPPEGEGALCTSHFFLFDVRTDKVEPKWLQAIFDANYLQEQLDAQAKGTTGYAAVRPKILSACEIPLPPLADQRRVVARIEELAAQINEAGALRQQAADEAESLVGAKAASIFRAALKNGSQSLQTVAELERGKFSHRPRNEPRFFGGAHPWIQIGEIENSNKFIRNWTQTLNDDGLAITKKFPRGTILISIAATIGAVGILDFDCCVPDSIVGVTPREGTSSEFIYHYLGYLRGHLEEIAPQSAQKNINLQILSQVPVPKLSLHEQRQIVSELDQLQSEVDALKRLQVETAAELAALVPSILDKAFRGEL